MFCESFPDLAWLKKQAESRFSNRAGLYGTRLQSDGWPTVILHVKAGETFRDNIPGPLSIFSNRTGTSWVTTEGRKTHVVENCFFVSNAGQRYSLGIDEGEKAETLNVHFGEQWATGVWQSLAASHDSLLEQPDQWLSQSMEFYNRLYPKNGLVDSLLNQLVREKELGALRRDEILYQLMSHLVIEQGVIKAGMRQLPVAKSSTREEILKRLLMATDYIYSYFTRPISLDELAAVSCLSKFHFLRLFKLFYGQTPHQYITSLRIEKSKALLASNLDVQRVADVLSFDCASTFSRLFFRQTGMSPRAFKSQQVRRFRN